MKPSSRIQATIDILTRIAENTRVPMDSAVGDYMRQRRYIGAKDRAEIAQRVYNMTRAHARIGWWLDKTGMDHTARNRVLVWLAFGENGGDGVKKSRLKELFDGSKYAPAPLDEKELKRFGHMEGRDFNHPDMPLEIRTECPSDYEAALKEYFGDSFEDEMAALIPAATLDLRVNIFSTTREDARTSLKADGIDTEETPYSPWGLRCSDKAYLAKTKALTKGHVSIQDEGSQLIAYLCEAKPGMQVLDFCAGAGGKTLALAASMQRKGRIVAMDTDARRLEKGRQRYKKSGLADIIEVRCLDDEKQRKWLKRQKEKFDIVLTDVPCTGTGTWRRNPDMRWNTYGPGLDELTAIQTDILERACTLVKSGGRLIYATCSLLPAENEDQIEAFLKNHPGFELHPAPDNLGTPYMRLTPHRHNTDGFFAAVMRRKV
jgi:16S rRNA (cytosine967-C5)-methyltransferase